MARARTRIPRRDSEPVEAAHALLFQCLEQFAFGQFDAVDERLEGGVAGHRLAGDGGEGALHVVSNHQHVARERRDAIGTGVRDLAFGAAPQVLHLGQGAQQLVLQVSRLGARRYQFRSEFRGLGQGCASNRRARRQFFAGVGGHGILGLRHHLRAFNFGISLVDIGGWGRKIKPRRDRTPARPSIGSQPWPCSPPSE